MMDHQPMNFFVRKYETAWFAARDALAKFIGASPNDIVLVDNATAGMNVIADSFPLAVGDEVLLTDHAYGAVHRIWERRCRRVGTHPPRIARLTTPVNTAEQLVEELISQLSPATRLLIVSHITSATAITLPVEMIVAAARSRGVRVCIDGPHAVAQLPLNLAELGCDYYTASCHKWLSAPLGSGFLYARPDAPPLSPATFSWGRLKPQVPQHWTEEFIWSGTRDNAAQLAIPAAIDYLQRFGWDRFRDQTHALARYARLRLSAYSDRPFLVPDSRQWYGCMALVPLPPGPDVALQQQLWEQFRIEVPIISWQTQRFVRVSCHLYNTQDDIDRLHSALGELL